MRTERQARTNGRQGGQRGGCIAAFSLIEVMVVVALLSVIIIGLVAMFNQTQRALVVGTTQVDYLESGRAATELLAREFQQMRPGGGPNVNFHTEGSYGAIPPASGLPTPPFRYVMTDSSEYETNAFQQIYFLTEYNGQWKGVGYFIDSYDVPPTPNPGDAVDTRQMGLGTLYRYETNSINPYAWLTISNLYVGYVNRLRNPATGNIDPTRLTNSAEKITRIVDGVVDFKIRSFDLAGRQITDFNVPQNTFVSGETTAGEYYVHCFSNAMPAYVELELGVLENRALERFKSLTNSPVNASKYLQEQGSRIHIFRQRISIRNVDPSVY